MIDDARLFDVSELAVVPVRPKMPSPRDAGVQARNFHGWTLDKLSLFELYLKTYRRVAGSGTFIDAFAGDGSALVGGRVVPGSAQIALDSTAFRFCRFYEKNEQKAERLDQMVRAGYSELVRGRSPVIPGDSNRRLLEDLSNGLIDRDRPCFALLDQDSTQLSWDTLEALARYKSFVPGVDPRRPKQCKVELWILFNTHQVLMRLVPKVRGAQFWDSGEALTLDRVMGGRDAWSDLVNSPGRLHYGHLLGRYVDRLKALGYDLVRACEIRDPSTGRRQYYMVHASDHPAAHSFMHWARKEQLTSTGRTPSMFTEGQLN